MLKCSFIERPIILIDEISRMFKTRTRNQGGFVSAASFAADRSHIQETANGAKAATPTIQENIVPLLLHLEAQGRGQYSTHV